MFHIQHFGLIVEGPGYWSQGGATCSQFRIRSMLNDVRAIRSRAGAPDELSHRSVAYDGVIVAIAPKRRLDYKDLTVTAARTAQVVNAPRKIGQNALKN